MSNIKKLMMTAAGGDGVYEISSVTKKFVTTHKYDISDSGTLSGDNGFTFRPDGTQLWIVNTADDVIEFNLSTAWDLSTLSKGNVFGFQAQQTNAFDIAWKTDGTKFYIIGSLPDKLSEYDCSTAWDITTATHNQDFTSLNDSLPRKIVFKSDGTRMYEIGLNNETIYQYDLSTAWDISTASFDTTKVVSGQSGGGPSLHFKTDGTKFYYVGNDADTVFEFSMTTAWDISTATHTTGDDYDLTSEIPSSNYNSQGIFIKPDGTKLYVLSNDHIIEFSISTAWDITTTSYTAPTTGYLEPTRNSPHGLFISEDGTKLVVSNNNLNVDRYDLSTADDIATASYLNSASTASIQNSNNVDVFFKPDGTKMFLLSNASNTIDEYSLSTAWDLTTVSYTTNVTSTDATPEGLTFSSNGLYAYTIGAADTIYTMELSTAWDLSTATAGSSKSVSAQTTNPKGIDISKDGTIIIIADNDLVYQYNLSTAYDVSTATYTRSYSISDDMQAVEGLRYRRKGNNMYLSDNTFDILLQYTLN